MGPLLRTPGEGADTAVWLAADPAAAGETGRLFLDRRPRPFDRVPTTRVTAADRRRLWDAVVGLADAAIPHRTRRSEHPEPHDQPPRSNDMTRIHERIETVLPIDAAFDYIADFANSQTSGIRARPISRRLDDGPVGRGSRYALDVRMGGRIAPMEYRIRDFERPRRVVLVGVGLRRRCRRRHPLRARR